MKIIILIIILIYFLKYVLKSHCNIENKLIRYMKHEKFYIDLNQNSDELIRIIEYSRITREKRLKKIN